MNKINLKLAKEKGLINDNDTLYKQVVHNYKYLLEYYLNTIIDFSKYEKDINDSNLLINKNPKFKELNEYLDLDYLFLVNNLFVEKLNEKDLNLLISKFNKDSIDNELLEIVKNTFKDVIKDNYFKEEYVDKTYKVCYGPFVPYNFVDNDSLVFRFYYGKNLTNVEGDEFYKLSQNQLSFIEKEMDKLKKEINEKLDVKCEILIKKDIDEK